MSVTFLGASITQFTANMGWNDEVSRLQVSLVEDDTQDDYFNPPIVGAPVYFNFEGWTFGGLLEKWDKSFSFSGNPVYNVSVVDPRDLLTGVQIILDNYYGPTLNVPNVANVFGYLENSYGFGGSGRNDSGMPWLAVIGGIQSLINGLVHTGYGSRINYKGFLYALDLTGLPFVHPAFRIGGTTAMSLMDVLREICEAAGCEMFFNMEQSNGINFIRLFTINRANIPSIGIINQFVNTTPGAVSKEVGLEMVNDVCEKMVFGGKKEMLYYQVYNAGDDEDIRSGVDNTIWPYWGTDLDGNVVIADYLGINHQFTLDARDISLSNVPPWYPTDAGEMIASLTGYGAWVSYIWLNSLNQYVIEQGGIYSDRFYECKIDNGGLKLTLTNINYPHNGILNPHFLKGPILGLTSSLNMNISTLLFGKGVNTIIDQIQSNKVYNAIGVQIDPNQELHHYIKQYADKFYGRQFMVRIPSVYYTQDPDTGQYTYSALPINAAWIDDYTVAQAQEMNLLPYDTTGISDSQNKIYTFVRYDDVAYYDFSDIPKDSIFFGGNGSSVYIRCEIEPNFVFVQGTARAIITLPGIVGIRKEFNKTIIGPFLALWMTDDNIKNLNNFLFTTPSGAGILNSKVPLANIPNVAAVPLELQTELYGPWYIATSEGKLDVVYEDSLVPWNYGGIGPMNIAGQAKVAEIGVKLQTLEYGSVEYPGVPVLQLGQQLLSVGPYVTDIQVNIGVQGITTRYSMKSWTPRFGQLAKYMVERFTKIARTQTELIRQIRETERKIVK